MLSAAAQQRKNRRPTRGHRPTAPNPPPDYINRPLAWWWHILLRTARYLRPIQELPVATAPFHTANMSYAYQLHFHVGFRTRRRVPVFRSAARADTLREAIAVVCSRGDYHVLEMQVDEYCVRLLLSLRPTHAPSKVVQTIKANSSRILFQRLPEIEHEIGRRNLWSRGYYLRSVGDVPSEVVRDYIANQREHHEGDRRNSFLLAQYAHPDPARFYDLRPFEHCVAEYNCHFVCSPVRHVAAIERVHAGPLVTYIRRVAQARGFEVLSLAVISDHLHLLAALHPTQAPEHLALAVMNNTSHWFETRNPGVFRAWDVPGFWTCSAFLRTTGAVTTNQVRAHLLGREGRDVLPEEE